MSVGARSIANNNHIFINMSGTPVLKDDMYLSSGRGYIAYVAVSDQFIKTLFEDMCVGKATDKYVFPSGTSYDKFELDCRDKEFFSSDSFQKICENNFIASIFVSSSFLTTLTSFSCVVVPIDAFKTTLSTSLIGIYLFVVIFLKYSSSNKYLGVFTLYSLVDVTLVYI